MPGYLNEFGSSKAAVNLANILKNNHPEYHNKVACNLRKYFNRMKLIGNINDTYLKKYLIGLITREFNQRILSNEWPELIKTHVLNVAKVCKMKYLEQRN